MKKLIIIILIFTYILISCKKTDSNSVSMIPVVTANDTTVTLPYSNATILFKKLYPDNYVFVYTLMSGPTVNNKIIFLQLNNGNMVVSGLDVAGVYKFQVSATYLNQVTKDIFTITVLPDNNTYTTETILPNLVWRGRVTGFGGSETYIDNFYSIISGSSKPFKMYVKGLADPNPNWYIIAPFELDPNFDYYHSFFQKGPTTRVVTEFEADIGDNLAIKIVY